MKYQISAKVAFDLDEQDMDTQTRHPATVSTLSLFSKSSIKCTKTGCLTVEHVRHFLSNYLWFFFFFSFLSWVTLPTNRFVAHSGQPVKSQLKCHILERFIMTINLKSIALHSTFMNSALVFFLGLINNSYPVYYNI